MDRSILPEPPGELKRISDELCGRIRSEIADGGPVPFSRFMEMALYEPGLGYYSAGLHKLGRSGDYVTAPELGPLFATCLGRHLAAVSAELDGYQVLEVGAGTGRLAADLLNGLGHRDAPLKYRILERSADLRAAQKSTLERKAPKWAERVEWLDRPPHHDWQGVLIANELLDALAVERFEIGPQGVSQLCVDWLNGRFVWASKPAPEELAQAVRRIEAETGAELPEGYRSEINLQITPWLKAVTRRLSRGICLFIDYGSPRAEYYRPDRSDGTLMCHYRHRAHDDVFFWPGLQDITAWVDFTALAEAGESAGLGLLGYTRLATYLLGCGLEEVLHRRSARSTDGGLSLALEARQLTLPEMMGERFKVMGLGRGLEGAMEPFSLFDLTHRL
jgi:SAM-dependent MidA family methyltransferase